MLGEGMGRLVRCRLLRGGLGRVEEESASESGRLFCGQGMGEFHEGLI
jgi:hypothetical protein